MSADKDTSKTYGDYTEAALGVAETIESRDDIHGNPDTFAMCFAGMLQAYMRPLVQAGRPVSPADALVILDLMKTARIAVGGPHPEHFHDKAGYALLAQVHVARTIEAGRAAQAAPAMPSASVGFEVAPAGDAPINPAPMVLPEGAEWPISGKPNQDVISTDGRKLGAFDKLGDFYPEFRPEAEDTEPKANPEYAPVLADGGDLEAQYAAQERDRDVDDADLLRWALDPAADPLADLTNHEGGLRPGVTVEELEGRKLRIATLLRAEGTRLLSQTPADTVALKQVQTALARYAFRDTAKAA